MNDAIKVGYKSRRADKVLYKTLRSLDERNYVEVGSKKQQAFRINSDDSYGRYDELICTTDGNGYDRQRGSIRNNLGKVVSITVVATGKEVPFNDGSHRTLPTTVWD